MSLLGLDIGTTGVKAIAFSADGKVLAQAYQEYHPLSPKKGWLEFDSRNVFKQAKMVIKEVASKTKKDPIKAFSVSSLGEASIPDLNP